MRKTLRRGLAGVALFAVLASVGTTASFASVKAPKVKYLFGVSCASTTHCWAVGATSSTGVILATTDGGKSWHAQVVGGGASGGFSGITCPSVFRCWAAGGRPVAPDLLATTDGGTHWMSQTLPKQMERLDGVACVGSSHCWAVGEVTPRDEVVVAVTTNGGGTWKLEKTPKLYPSMNTAFAIACPSEKQCVVVGEGAMTTTNGGSSWKLRKTAHAFPLVAVSCPSTSDCVALGEVTSGILTNEEADIVSSTDGGSTWVLRVRQVPSVGNLRGVSCVTTKDCVAVGSGYTVTGKGEPPPYKPWGAIFTSANAGATWKRHTRLAAVEFLSDVSCASAKDCVAVGATSTGGAIVATTDGGTTWKAQSLP